MIFRRASCISIPLAVALLICNQAFSTIYYVKTVGSDSNDGLTTSTAFRTIKKAANVVRSGDRVYVGIGTYTEDIFVDGVQQSTQPVQFIAEVSNVGDVVVDAAWKVSNSNYVQINGFKFQGTKPRFLVWTGSYDGVLEDCRFNSGDEGLLIKDGSLTLDNCQILNFAHDGLQIDGEALVTLRNATTISGCQEAGIEVRKVARVVLDGCTISGNAGDGVEVAITVDEIDDGPDTPIDKRHLSVGRTKFEMSGGFVKGYNSEIGPSSIGNTGAASSNTEITVWDSFVYGDAYIGSSGTVDDPSHVSGAITTMTEPLSLPLINDSYYATNNDNANIPLTDDGENPLNADLDFTLSGGDGIDLPPGTYYFNKVSLSGGSVIRISGPVVIYSEECDFSGGSMANPSLKTTDCQLYARKDNISFSGSSAFYGSAYAPLGKVNLSGGSSFYGMLAADQIKSSGSGSIYIDEALLPVAEKIFAGSFGPPSIPAPPSSWVPISDGELVINGTAVTGNRTAVNVSSPQTLVSQFSQFENNAEWGLYAAGPVDLQDCTVDNNPLGGMWLKGITATDLQVDNVTLTNNGTYGLFAESCDLTFDVNNAADLAISGSAHTFAASGGSLTFDGVTISGGSTAGVLTTGATLTVRNAYFQNNGYGIAAENSSVLVEYSTVSQNSVGLYSIQNTLTVRDSTIHNNTVWGAAVYASAAAGITATFESSTIHSNAGGLALLDGTDGDLLLRSGTVIRDNTNAGLHLENCNLTIDDQAGGGNWSVTGNGHGINSRGSTLALVDVTAANGSLYGVRCEDSTVSLTNCTISGVGGVYADAANNNLTLHATKVDATGTGGWGVVCHGGNLELKNTLVDGFDGGIFLDIASGIDQAEVTNCTLGRMVSYGIHLDGGSAQVRNTIIAGTGSGTGLSRAAGQLTHSYNLIHGFANPVSGTSIDAMDLLKNPRFVDEATGDLHLAVGSPAINTGMDMGLSVTTDLEGNVRPSFRAFEIGAYEYTNPNGSLRVREWLEKK